MSYSTDFREQWKNLCNCLESNMIETVTVDVENISRLLKNQIKRWYVSGEYNYAWLEKLKKQNQEVASEFEKALNNVKFEAINEPRNPSFLPWAAITLGGAAVGFGVPIIAAWGVKVILICGISLTAVVGYVGINIYKQKKDMRNANIRKTYIAQLEKAGSEIVSILRKADIE